MYSIHGDLCGIDMVLGGNWWHIIFANDYGNAILCDGRIVFYRESNVIISDMESDAEFQSGTQNVF